MIRIATVTALLAGLLLAASPALWAQEQEKSSASTQQEKKDSQKAPEKTEAEPPRNESPLVKAARQSKEKREGEKSRITITNADVEKSGGKLIQSTDKPLDPIPESRTTPEEIRRAAAEKSKVQRRTELQALVTKHQQTVTELEKELRRIEETYYNEDDPDYREDVLSNNFDETKKQLEDARKELAAARRALSQLDGN